MARMGVQAVLKFVLDHCFESQRLSLIGYFVLEDDNV
jgi:hypothetical protein